MEKIKHIHFNILTEIVQANTLCNVQVAKGVGSLESLEKSTHSDLPYENTLENPNDQVVRLQRYIGQLVQAKTLCDNRLRCLEKNGNNVTERAKNESFYGTDDQYHAASMSNTMLGQQSISLAFDDIMKSPFSRRYFYSYLEKYGKGVENVYRNNQEQRPFSKLAVPPYQVITNDSIVICNYCSRLNNYDLIDRW